MVSSLNLEPYSFDEHIVEVQPFHVCEVEEVEEEMDEDELNPVLNEILKRLDEQQEAISSLSNQLMAPPISSPPTRPSPSR